MPNCDWGKPCDCRECRTKEMVVVCPSCNFENVVEVEGKGHVVTGRKGMWSYEFTYPEGQDMTLGCFRCDHMIRNVKTYTSVSTGKCERNLQKDQIENTAVPCDQCGAKIDSDYNGFYPVDLKEYGNSLLCIECYSKAIELDTPDPSNDLKKYYFDDKTLTYVLDKVKVPCEECGKYRWLKAENTWKKKCLNCYRKS